MDEDLKKEWQQYRNSVCEGQTKSQDDFEKYINLITSGALGLTLTFIDKIIPIDKAIYIWIIALGWSFLAFTLLLNLYSHYQSAKFSGEILKHIDDENYDSIFVSTTKCNKIINYYNKVTIVALFLGIIAIIIFVTINIYNMSEKEKDKGKSQNKPRPLTEERGRVIPTPPREKPNTNNPKK